MTWTKVVCGSGEGKTTTIGPQPVARETRGLEKTDEGRTEEKRGGRKEEDDEGGGEAGQESGQEEIRRECCLQVRKAGV